MEVRSNGGRLSDTLQWDLLSPKGLAPSARGYHTLTSVGTFVALYGGKGELGIAPSDNNLRCALLRSFTSLSLDFHLHHEQGFFQLLALSRQDWSSSWVLMMPFTCSIYDAAANTWSVVEALGTSPLPRSNHAAALLGENLVIIHGGRNGTERLSDICALRVGKHHSKLKEISHDKHHLYGDRLCSST